MHRKRVNISTVLAGQRLGVKEVDDGIWIVSFRHYDLGFIDLEQKPCNPSTTPSAQGCHPCLRYVSLPMSPVRPTDSSVERRPTPDYPAKARRVGEVVYWAFFLDELPEFIGIM